MAVRFGSTIKRAGSGVDAIAVAGRLTGDDDADGARTFVQRLMLLAGGDLDSISFLKDEVVMLDLHGQFAFENVEELARVDVGMADFAG
jgi:hypothetical protein